MSDAHDRLAGLDPERLAQLAKTNRAIRQPGTVLEAKTGGYLVASRSIPGAFWLVDGADCSCPAGRNGLSRCWHRDAVAKFCRMLDESMKRPSAPPATSMLVD